MLTSRPGCVAHNQFLSTTESGADPETQRLVYSGNKVTGIDLRFVHRGYPESVGKAAIGKALQEIATLLPAEFAAVADWDSSWGEFTFDGYVISRDWLPLIEMGVIQPPTFGTGHKQLNQQGWLMAAIVEDMLMDGPNAAQPKIVRPDADSIPGILGCKSLVAIPLVDHNKLITLQGVCIFWLRPDLITDLGGQSMSELAEIYHARACLKMLITMLS